MNIIRDRLGEVVDISPIDGEKSGSGGNSGTSGSNHGSPGSDTSGSSSTVILVQILPSGKAISL